MPTIDGVPDTVMPDTVMPDTVMPDTVTPYLGDRSTVGWGRGAWPVSER